jgi:hypothetical protein
MSHFSVLILGLDPELQLEPFAELTGNDGPVAEDYRAEFDPHYAAEDIPAEAARAVAQAEADGLACAAGYRAALEAKDYADILADWVGGEAGPDGDWGFYRNPNAKWDWFMLGGRWQGKLRLHAGRSGKSGECSWTNDGEPEDPNAFDQAEAGDIDWAATRQELTPFAVLKDGEWHEQGEMGWWGQVRDPKADAAWETEVDALLKDLPPETLVSVYDCHT